MQKSTDEGHRLYSFQLPAPLAPGSSLKIRLQLVLVHSFKPKPASVRQGALPYVIIEDSATWLSPYGTDTETVTYRLGTHSVLSFTEPGKKERNNVVYGPMRDTAPYTIQPVVIHFAHDRALATVTYLVKEIEVCYHF